MQQNIHDDQQELPSRQYRQQNERYGNASGTPEALEVPIASIPFDVPQASISDHAYAYQDGYRGDNGPQEPFVSAGSVSPNQQQIYYVPVHPASFRTQDAGVDGKVLAAASYIGFWFTGMLLFLFVRENRFIRFHALQSTLFFFGVMMLYIIAPFAFSPFWNAVPGIRLIAGMGFLVVTAVAAVAWFVGFFGALSGKCYKLPIAGDLAALWIKPHETTSIKF